MFWGCRAWCFFGVLGAAVRWVDEPFFVGAKNIGCFFVGGA